MGLVNKINKFLSVKCVLNIGCTIVLVELVLLL